MSKDTNSGILKYHWWIPMITGLLAIGLGIWCLCDPSGSLPVLAYTFAACLVFAGCMNFSFAIMTSNRYSGWGWSIALGILELIGGVWLWCLPMPILIIAFMYIIGIWILVVAINGISEACVMSSVSPGWIIWTILLLLATIAFAIVFVSNPLLSGITEWIWLGICLITYGAYRISFSIRIKQLGNTMD